MAQITRTATASLTARGTTTATGTITWSVPSLPSGITKWDSVTISGTWTWGGKGSINYVKINNINTTTGVPFNINLSTSVTSPLSISCVGNKNATGSTFTWSNLTVTYTYTEPITEQLKIKQNGAWVNVSKVYKKINGVWVEQTDLKSVFNTNTNYVKGN